MAEFTLKVNGTKYKVEAAADTPLLWILRDHLGLTGIFDSRSYGAVFRSVFGVVQTGLISCHAQLCCRQPHHYTRLVHHVEPAAQSVPRAVTQIPHRSHARTSLLSTPEPSAE